MGLEMRGVDHQPLGLAALSGQFGENPVEHPKAAPADKAVVDRLVRTVILRRVRQRSPLRITKMIPEITRRSSTRARHATEENRFDPAHLRLRKPNQITHRSTSR